MNSEIIGWDIGGAHIKAAVVNRGGEITAIFQKPCPLWQGIDNLKHAVMSILNTLPQGGYDHAVTMTGELVDLFENRNKGVKTIIDTMAALLPQSDLLIYAGKMGFLSKTDVGPEHYEAIASANWLASASYAAQKIGSGLFIDIGSTTTDILLVSQGSVTTEGYTDYERLTTQELVYTGIVRTAVMAIAQTVQDEGREVGVMAEYFATMADVYRVTGELNELHDQCDTADGAEKTVLASARRLSRMIGCDFNCNELPRWRKLAENLRAQQLEKIMQSCEKQLTRAMDSNAIPFIGAGIGRFLVRQLAEYMGHAYVDFSDLTSAIINEESMTVADCAPAAAVANLAKDYVSAT